MCFPIYTDIDLANVVSVGARRVMTGGQSSQLSAERSEVPHERSDIGIISLLSC